MKVRVLLALALTLLAVRAAGAQETPHYPNGTSGLKAGTVPPPGWYYLEYNYFYHADSLRTTGGPSNFDLDAYANVHRIIDVTHYKILGADYAWNIVIPIVHSNIDIFDYGVHDSATQLADFNAEPFVIEWHEARYDFGYVYGFFAPTGSYNSLRPALPGKGYWTNYFGAAGTYYFDNAKSWSASFLSRYEINSKRRGTDFRLGDNFSFEWGVSKNWGKVLETGVSGYASWQATPSQGADVTNPNELARGFAIGPEIQYFSTRYGVGFHLRHWWEFGVRDRSLGQITTFTLVIPF